MRVADGEESENKNENGMGHMQDAGEEEEKKGGYA